MRPDRVLKTRDTVAPGPARRPGDAGRAYTGSQASLPGAHPVDWASAPGRFKVYSGVPRIAFGGRGRTAGGPRSGVLGDLLHGAYGVTRMRWTAPGALKWVGADGSAWTALRPVPSGGARFPAELYVLAGPDFGVPTGVYHYDPVHHGLVTLRAGDWRPVLARCLGHPRGPVPALTLLVGVVFGKSTAKYGDLGYRLCALDAGALIGQILTLAEGSGLQATVRYQFLDQGLEDLLGTGAAHEGVYGVITIDANEARATDPAASLGEPASPRGPDPLEVPAPLGENLPLDPASVAGQLHRASRICDPASLIPPGSMRQITTQAIASLDSLALAPSTLDLMVGLHTRRSSMGYFTPHKLTFRQFSALAATAGAGYANDIDPGPHALTSVQLFCAVNRVEDMPPGVYRYAPHRHTAELVRAADLHDELQAAALPAAPFNLAHVSLSIYAVGHYERGYSVYGDRWYRMQNMEAGIVLQRLHLASAALGLACRANLGYDVHRTDRLLGLDQTGTTSLVQVLIGTAREPGDFYEQTCSPPRQRGVGP